jgi:hypothetical protein
MEKARDENIFPTSLSIQGKSSFQLAGLALKNPPKKNHPKKPQKTHPKKTTKNVFWGFFKF